MSIIMKKEIKIALVVLIGFMSFLWLEKPLREYLSIYLLDEQTAKQVSAIVVRTILIIVVFNLIKKFKHINFTGLSNWKRFENIQALGITTVFIMIGLSQNWNTYQNTEFELLILFILSSLSVGVVEEHAFRGTILPLLIKTFKSAKKPVLVSAVLSSAMFGLVHFFNLFSQPENLNGITSQVFFATAIGVFFCGLMIRTENIIIPCIVHALINFSFGASGLRQSTEEVSKLEESSAVNWGSIIPTTIFFSFIFIGGIYMIVKSDRKAIFEKLELE